MHESGTRHERPEEGKKLFTLLPQRRVKMPVILYPIANPTSETAAIAGHMYSRMYCLMSRL